ncbi:MAG: MBL fold metallo-hydrolase [Thermoleophilia bacterium]|nr:MBL fold metallo-hydrolase [Gaiellaceae bacterium]MDW8338586.1 MBL fold metallo-hydrolase [Thermoleophilia bacterium]
MRLTVIGCSPAWPNPGGAHSGYLVEDGTRLLLDCGPGVLARLREMEGWPKVDAIAITHFHLDHWGDLVPWVWGSMYRDDEHAVRSALLLPPGGRAFLEDLGLRLGFPDMFERTFQTSEYRPGNPVAVGSLEVTPVRVPHYTLETYAFRVESGGRALAYSGDSGPSDHLAEAARDAHLFVCEATLQHGRLDGEPRGHLSLEEAVAIFEASGARRLLVTHRPCELPTPEGYELAYDGLELDV